MVLAQGSWDKSPCSDQLAVERHKRVQSWSQQDGEVPAAGFLQLALQRGREAGTGQTGLCSRNGKSGTDRARGKLAGSYGQVKGKIGEEISAWGWAEF